MTPTTKRQRRLGALALKAARASAALCLLLSAKQAEAQQHEIFDPNIASLQVTAGTDWQGLPLTTLGGEPIVIGFDELSHEYHRYTYRLEHCEADWTATEGLFTSDYLEGFADGNLIDDYAESEGTYQLYTHYELTFPNRHCRITMSGNYRLYVYDDNEDDDPVLAACFMVSEQKAGLSMAFTTDTDIDINNAHQQILLQTSYGQLRGANPQQFKTVVLQNQHWPSAVSDARAQMTLPDGQRWEHCRELIFKAGSEYHKFETLDPTHATMGIASVAWDERESQWHAFVQTDEPRRQYYYDVDANGSFLIRNSDNYNVDTYSDYIVTHFTLKAPRQKGDVYLSGQWTYGSLSPEFLMEWNDEEQLYEGAVLLKQGYYSYRYVLQNADGSLSNLSCDGNFYETENRYDALLYYRGPGDRTDRLVANCFLYTRER